ncbi:MAG: cupin domain-containing protein [Anaerolineales bacterium]|nr:cupin domain-containing protein [Anaerolineales bacterium]
MLTAQEVINLLQLEPLPHEGGFFHQTYRSPETIPAAALPARYEQERVLGTAIYFLLTPIDFSAMHRLDTAEIYHFYYGDPLEMLLLHPAGSGELFLLGNNLGEGQRPQKVVERDVWQGTRLAPGGQHGFALIGTTMAPGFEWVGFELGERDTLVQQYPDFGDMIAARVR